MHLMEVTTKVGPRLHKGPGITSFLGGNYCGSGMFGGVRNNEVFEVDIRQNIFLISYLI